MNAFTLLIVDVKEHIWSVIHCAQKTVWSSESKALTSKSGQYVAVIVRPNRAVINGV